MEPPPPAPAFPPARVYPAWLEAWWVARACAHLGAPVNLATLALPALTGAVQQLSDLFTVGRPAAAQGFPDYGKDAKLALAYGLFYFPAGWVRARFPLAEAAAWRGWRPLEPGTARPVRVLDLGAGSGASGLGAAMLLRERGLAAEVELTAVDHSPGSVALLTALVRENAAHLPGLRVRTVARDALAWTREVLPRADEPFDLILLGHALNEMLPVPTPDEPTEPAAAGGKSPTPRTPATAPNARARVRTPPAILAERVALAHAFRRALSPRGLLLIIEPALRETAEPLQELSDTLCDAKILTGMPPLPRWGPYLGDHACPLLAAGQFWNHEVRAWKAPASVALLNRKLWRDIRDVKFAYALHGVTAPTTLTVPPTHETLGLAETELSTDSATPKPADASASDAIMARLVSPFHELKGRFVAAAVAADGRHYTVELPTRGLPKAVIRRLEDLERGDVLSLRDGKFIGIPPMFRLPGLPGLAGWGHIE